MKQALLKQGLKRERAAALSGLTTEQADLAFAKTSSYDELAEDVGRCGEEGLTLRPKVAYPDEAVWVNQQWQLEQGDPPSKRGSRRCDHIFWRLPECLKGPLLLTLGLLMSTQCSVQKSAAQPLEYILRPSSPVGLQVLALSHRLSSVPLL